MFGDRRRRLPTRQSLRGRAVVAFAATAGLVSALLVAVVAVVGRGVWETLLLGALCGTAIGAIFGLWLSRRLLEPLRQVTGTAARIASGELGTRLPDTDDPDLEPTVAAFNTMVDSLQRRIDRERRLVGDVSHELRTPLTTLTTSVGVMARYEDELPERSRRALALVQAELDHLRRLLDDLLALARAEARMHAADAEPLSVPDLLTHTLAELRYPPDLLSTATGRDALVIGRKLELERAVVNLLDNAQRHGGGAVGVGVERRGDEIIVTVDDAGPGVAAEDRERIFDRFVTVRRSRKSGTGTGIGLALVAETVAAHGGTVSCTDRPGGGARFTVKLPGIPREK
ncbi:HAMP domain-containing histidine kinase [Nocardia terpenica]|nr:HAMP domain-containing histidine kinase [Nocardia terpenica]MBF6108563.1 HAMP domain-containing histidine kinase [Nocardia terpenica]MBF6116109.1 HAMP domain-containing histidine kinase [Nocardia terpenica]MBF6123770.1 HAMP domain-containing histidine kinase [Nocardia terpenica]MBF6157083.1 HAMP domain-containing histidine kinase [Nocardia terpenica]